METVAFVTGAVVAKSDDPNLQRPIEKAVVTAAAEGSAGQSVSESSGLFRVPLQPPVAVGEVVSLSVNHPDYQPFRMTAPAGDQIHVVRLTPSVRETPAAAAPGHEVQISNIRVRYATRIKNTSVIGTAVRTFEVVNKGNVPCQGRQPCSPDGRWKASIDSLTLNTGEESKQFRNVRVSCIAGPCAFSRVEADRFSRGGQVISVSVRNWSDTVTYLLEAEVAHTMESELIRYTYPVTFGRSMNFTLPPEATGPSIEADLNGSAIVFPLGPALRLSWAACRFERGPEDAKQYRCELKPRYRF
jgi:hypothetical protein